MRRKVVAGDFVFVDISPDDHRPAPAEKKDKIEIDANINLELLVRSNGQFKVVRADAQTATVLT